MIEVYICIDCGGKVLFDSLVSGSEGKKAVITWCRCHDRDTNIDKMGEIKKTRQIDYQIKCPTFR